MNDLMSHILSIFLDEEHEAIKTMTAILNLNNLNHKPLIHAKTTLTQCTFP